MSFINEMMILELNKPEDIKKWMADPETIVCSDAMSCLNPKDYSYYDWDEPFEGKSVHPRTSGMRGTFLRMVREEKEMNVDLMTAISRMSFLPAKCYDELCGIPHFRWKGRMQVGCDADITIFDPETVTDNSSYDIGKGMIPTTGSRMHWSNGVIVVKDSVVQKVFPGQPIRFPIQPKGRVDQLKIDPPYRPTMGENTRHIEHMNMSCC